MIDENLLASFSSFSQERPETSSLVGSNKFEILLFELGTNETFGMNVFKIREITKTPLITKTPHVHPGIEGVVSLRGNIIPVLNLCHFLNIPTDINTMETMMITEFNRRTQAFLVSAVDRIVRVDWNDVRSPVGVLNDDNVGLITSITQLDDGRLVSIIDAEQIIVDAFGEPEIRNVESLGLPPDYMVFYADDSAIARKEIQRVIDGLGVSALVATNGNEAWDRLQAIANEPNSLSKLKSILIDVEMPGMDGYVLTQNIKKNPLLKNIPVILHSSLSSEANRVMGDKVGANDYVAKFDAATLAQTLSRQLLK